MDELIKGSHNVYDCRYYIIWGTKYNFKILEGKIGTRIVEILKSICDEYNIRIIKGKATTNKIFIQLSFSPKLSISKAVQCMKGKSSKIIKEEFPELLDKYKHGHLWATGYFVRTIGKPDDEGFDKYVSSFEETEELDIEAQC